ncbi:DUF1015 domain-containing protein [Petrocella sp. FN5]|uniref:DUF1015 domain-containing protein n=1 Tax=Petrocella sp. FN5 TaxID=3032002 RepID=UPI0023D9E054|nr:DUF1015 family protein [Petrocella sp. FN5]MDF1616226.1 DUF1015 family protein [Petrocella sp. FN5]
MSIIKPFMAVRPAIDLVKEVAALPYDVYNSKEARAIVEKNPRSFLAIDRAETFFDESVDSHSEQIYKKAHDVLYAWIEDGTFVQDDKNTLYLYELVMNGRSQIGIVSCTSVDEYLDNKIKKHEKTRADKEADRIHHVDYCNANTGPIFLTYKSNDAVNALVEAWKTHNKPIYDFVAEDGIVHRVWSVDDDLTITSLREAFEAIETLYIADGHHRAASAVKVAQMRREANPGYTGDEAFNYFLSVSFPDEQLCIMDYNRVVKDLNGLTESEFFEAIKKQFEIVETSKEPIRPREKAMFAMTLDDIWYLLKAKENSYNHEDPVLSLDVSILQLNLLSKVLGIGDPRIDQRIDFVGGIRGLEELARRTKSDMKIGFAMYPTSIEELMAIADADQLMPPKSTWFEPKLRSGLFIHLLE